MIKADLLIIDPQVDFCSPSGSLYVPGADEDCKRLTTMIKRVSNRVNDIHVTLDTHHYFDIAHPVFWKDSKGEHPAPFTLITPEDIDKGTWVTSIPSMQKRARDYIYSLKDNNRYLLCIWPPHCLIGSGGAVVVPEVWDAFLEWETQKTAFVDYVTKGSNFWTEHYSAVQADVPDPDDPGTQLNVQLIQMLQNVDIIAISGQARSHCLKHTITDIANNFGEENIKKFVFLEDTSSDVPGFENLGKSFVKDLSARGMQVMKSTDFLA